MIDIEILTAKYDAKDYSVDYQKATPVPWILFDDFLPQPLLADIQRDIDQIPLHVWSVFDRNGSHMLECNNLKYAPLTRMLALYFNSSEFISWLEALTGHQKLIGDPHLIGAGLMRCGPGHSLKLHTDFNWNEQLRLNRCVSMILYTSKTWQPDWGGGLEFWSIDRQQCQHVIEPRPNRLLIWDYHEHFAHGHPSPIQCPTDASRDGLRMFYFTSNSTPISQPHRSLYWFDETSQKPFDLLHRQ